MIEELKALLTERGFTRSVIVDDAYDAMPKPDDIAALRWDRFFDDLRDDDHNLLESAFGKQHYESQNATQLRQDPLFVSIVWSERKAIAAADELFAEFDHTQDSKRRALEPLKSLLTGELGMECATCGREPCADLASADFVFLDLFLSVTEDEPAIRTAIDRIKAVVAARKGRPPNVILISGNPTLEEHGPRVRDDAELLGCQFRMMKKVDLNNRDLVIERLYDLAASYPDALRLSALLLAWSQALTQSRATFLRNIRTLDLRDYANMQVLILEAEGEPVGDYILDLYDLHLHNVLEGDDDLVRAAKAMNEIDWSEYPAAQFMPSSEVLGLMDGALFHNQTRTDIEAQFEAAAQTDGAAPPVKVRLGDVFVGPPPTAPSPNSEENQAGPVRYAYVVLSQACDLAHGEADRILLLRGEISVYSWTARDAKSRQRTPVMGLDGSYFSISWDVLAPETWLFSDLKVKLNAGYRRVRRLRTPFALQLQQAFIARLGRVGTLAELPGHHAASIRVYLRTRSNTAKLLTQASADEEKAVCLVGRTEKGAPKEMLVLAEDLVNSVQEQLRSVPETELPNGTQIAQLRENPAFFRSLRRSLVVNSRAKDGSKPLKGLGENALQILSKPTLEPGRTMAESYSPLVIELDVD